MSQTYTVTTRGKLLPFLFQTLEGWSKKTVKQRLQGSSVFVNGEAQTKHDYMLNIGDIIQVGVVQHTGHKAKQAVTKLEIIYQDKDLIAINKSAGLLSVGTAKENKQHALALLRTQLSRGKKSNNANSVKLWPVHRLDRETSGILLFATSKEVREAVMDKWTVSQKTYLAVVESTPKESNNTINQPLRLDDKEYRMHVGEHPDAKRAVTHYDVQKSIDTRSLLEINIETGRQHQIRAHMAWLGHPVIGDERYGTKGARMGLHAYRLKIYHPVKKDTLELEVEAPRDFYDLLR